MKISYDTYKRRLLVVLITGVVLGIILSIMTSLFFALVKDPSMSEVGKTVLSEEDCSIRVPKGTLIEGNALQEIELTGKIVYEEIKTPYITKMSMVIRCGEGKTSSCTLSKDKTYN